MYLGIFKEFIFFTYNLAILEMLGLGRGMCSTIALILINMLEVNIYFNLINVKDEVVVYQGYFTKAILMKYRKQAISALERALCQLTLYYDRHRTSESRKGHISK